MDISADRVSFLIVAAIFAGGALGSGLVYTQMSSQLDSLEENLENQNDADTQIVYVNGSDQSLAPIFEKADQSVVYISAQGEESSQGSGFVYSRRGHIITNEHVVDDADNVEVSFTDGTTGEATIVGTDPYSDLAVLKVQKDNLQPLKLGNVSDVRVGQEVVAIGNPFGLRGSMTSGIISQKGRSLPVQQVGLEGFRIRDVLQTDASINPGNSGGPLLNTEGEVIGVNTAIETNTGSFSGIGFAVPASTVKRVAPDIISDGDAEHPWIGVSGTNMNRDLAKEMETNSTKGFLVMNVSKDSPASKAGLQGGKETVRLETGTFVVGGDVVVGIDGEEMRDLDDILNYLAQDAEVDEEVELTIIRNGERMNIPLTLESRPED
ncbi:S1C family serine protease [Candidatus Nanohalobium constans]|uniref:Serine protease Do n=1 Tax=Candidatus Nanohalobium constans TaxID=2565781 RepID=A0A5Q0UHF3_9ARCH|nr:trypsin-like peptidase domain-containing protein [Candidatus Nanohalobium constans]QGA80791.1 serine protease Do [Candidatus Nanohalobium constans]